MTPITSSAASDTDRARNRTSGWVRPMASITAWPPPSGMCTSTSTTSGTRSPMSSMAAATSSASPTTSTASPSSARTPERKRWWSSTRKTRTLALGPVAGTVLSLTTGSCPGHDQLDLGPLARRAADDGGAPVARHPGPDRLGDALAVLGHRLGVESPTPVPHEDRDLGRLDLHEQRDARRARPFRRVHRRLLAGRQQRPQLDGQRAVPHRHRLHRHTVAGLDVTLDHGHRLGYRRHLTGERPRGPAFEEPGAQLALLGPGQARHLSVVAGGALDERQRLEHRVVHRGRHV